jgi:hypothetical protein
MADKIGVLGEATTTTAGTTTVYTVPASKAAKGKIFYRWDIPTDDTGDLTITVNGIAVSVRTNVTGTNFIFSNSTLLSHLATQVPNGSTAVLTASPAPFEYFLSAGDTVTYTLGGSDAVAMNLQFVGVEIDV